MVPWAFSGLFSARRTGNRPTTHLERHHLPGHVMHDPVDIRRRIDRVVARVHRRDDYGVLLARGAAVRALDEVDDVEAWRAEIRRHARADRIRVRTGFNQGIAWAMLARVPRSDELAEARRDRELL